MIAIEITAAIDAAGTLKTFYFSDIGMVTGPADTPANTAFIDKIKDSGRIGVNVFSDGRTGGGTKLETGEIVLHNNDGEFDAWTDYSFDGRIVVIRMGAPGAAYPAGFTTVFAGVAESVSTDFDSISIRVKDKQALFSTQLLTTAYAGNNVLPNGAEGTASDIKGKMKPRVYGKVFNIQPPCVNTSKLTYQPSDIALQSVDAVYDRGVALTAGADYADLAALHAATPAASSFITCKALGLVRLASNPAGQITMDVTQGATAGARTAAQLIKLVVLAAGLTAGEVSSADVTAMDTANSAVVGVFIQDTATTQSVLDQLSSSVGGWYGFDNTGTLRMGVLTAPSGTENFTVNEYDIYKSGMQRRAPKDNGIPIWQVLLNHTKIWTTQPSDLAGSVANDRRAYLSAQYRSTEAKDTNVKTQWKLAASMSVDTLLTVATDANTESTRLFNMYKVPRSLYDIPLDINTYGLYNAKLMDLVKVYHSRFGMASGKLFRLIGYRIELSKNRVILVVWG